MKEFKYVITDAMGLHARPAGQLVKAAAGYSCEVQLTANGTTVDAKRIMGVMRLAAKQGQEITITCTGADEDAAAAALESFVKENL